MLYYVQTGDIDTSIVAKTPREAAVGSIRRSGLAPGTCVIVSERTIGEEWSCDHNYFLTESIMEECMELRVVR
jgi:hypothetical protein